MTITGPRFRFFRSWGCRDYSGMHEDLTIGPGPHRFKLCYFNYLGECGMNVRLGPLEGSADALVKRVEADLRAEVAANAGQ